MVRHKMRMKNRLNTKSSVDSMEIMEFEDKKIVRVINFFPVLFYLITFSHVHILHI